MQIIKVNQQCTAARAVHDNCMSMADEPCMQAACYLSMVAKVSFRHSAPNPNARMDRRAVGHRMNAMTKLARTIRA